MAAYFGDSNTAACGHCSVCEAQLPKSHNSKTLQAALLTELKQSAYNSRELAAKVACDEASLIFALQTLLENKQIKLDVTNRYTLY